MAKETIVKQVDVMALMGALRTTGRAKLSDFAKPVETEMSEPLKKWNDLKKKHPDAILLFRCGDFYECYQEDADVVAKVCGITLSKCKGLGETEFYRTTGFPHHALDTYLPKLVRAGKRIAICDEIVNNDNMDNKDNFPTKREQSDVRIDSAEREESQTKFNNSNEKEEKDMRLNLNANKNESVNVQANAQVNNPIEDAVAVEIKDVDVQEVQDIVPVVTKKPTPKAEEPKEEKSVAKAENPAVTVPLSDHGTLVIAGMPKRDKNGKFVKKGEGAPVQTTPTPPTQEGKAAAEDPEAVGELAGKLTYATYEKQKTNKTTGKPYTVTHAKIMGFAATDEAYQRGVELHGAVSGEMVDGVKVLGLYFSHRYAAAAKLVCDALNAGKPFAECVAIIDTTTEENARKREEWKAKIEERKQKREERKAAKNQPSAVSPQTSGEKSYSSEDVAEMLRKVLAGGGVPEDIERLLKAA